MSDLKPSTRALLELGRSGDDPAEARIGQNRRMLAKRLGVAALGASAVAGSTSKATAAVFASTGAAAKAALLCGVVVVSALATWKVVQPSPRPQSAPAAVVLHGTPPPIPAPAAAKPLASDEAAAQVESAAPVSRATPSSRALVARSIKEELELVRAAQQALNRGEPEAALALLAQHARKFPSGVLFEDREASRVFALCRLGNVAGARAAADAFIRRAPRSPFLDRVRAACRQAAPSSSR
jgi:hypothetical protein